MLLFGRKLVPPWAHFVAALMVALGTLFSTFWILSTNSWMQTPAGYEIVDGRFVPKDWLQIIFNPSFPYRLAHVVDAVYITTGFVVVGVAASYLRQVRFVEEARTMLSMTLWLLTVLVPLQFLLGDAHGLNTLEHQPAKLAAIERVEAMRVAKQELQRNQVPSRSHSVMDRVGPRFLDETYLPQIGGRHADDYEAGGHVDRVDDVSEPIRKRRVEDDLADPSAQTGRRRSRSRRASAPTVG